MASSVPGCNSVIDIVARLEIRMRCPVVRSYHSLHYFTTVCTLKPCYVGPPWRVLRLRRVAANILNKQSRTADKGWSSSLGVGRGANNSSS
jgi:hypothetical protein